MLLIEPETEIYQVTHLPVVKAYADRLGLVAVINQLVPTEMEIDAGTVVLGLVLDTLSGRSPLYQLEEFFEHQDRELLLGRPVPAQAFNDDTVGRVLDRLSQCGTMKIYSECAVRACREVGLQQQHVHFDTTSQSVYGDYRREEDQEGAINLTYGYSKQKRPDLKQFVIATLCVDRAVPIFGQLEDGNASDKRVNNELLTQIAQIMARQGVAPGAYIYIADAAMVTEANLAAVGDELFITRLPASYKECDRVVQEAVQAQNWQDIGVLAETKPTKNRPVAFYQAYESQVTLYGKTYRAGVIHSSAEDQRQLKRLEREVNASYQALEAQVVAATRQEYFCRADAEAAAKALIWLASEYHRVEVQVQERPNYGPGRPSLHHPRKVNQMRYGLKADIQSREEVIQQQRQAAGCFVLLTTVPREGELAHDAGELLRAYKEQQGVERNFSFLKDPVIVNSLFLKRPERLEALGLVLLLALLIWRLMERSMRQYIATTGRSLTGWDKKLTQRPTSLMMTSKFIGVMVIKRGDCRQLVRPLSTVQREYLQALGVSEAYFIEPRAG